MAYVSANPAAADGLEGVQAVWLDGAATREETEAALAQLTAAGVLVSLSLPDGGLLYTSVARRHE